MATWAACLGCRTSLLSMAGIRYEGILCGINMDDSTVALAEVCLCGTEGCPAVRPVAPREEVYEYIVFHASEIKELTPCERTLSALHQDVAVVRSSPGTPGGAAARCHACDIARYLACGTGAAASCHACGTGAAASCYACGTRAAASGHPVPGTPTGPRGATGGHPGHAQHENARAAAVGHRPFVQPAFGGAAGPSRRGRPQEAQALNLGDEFQAEFDFESGNAQLDREELDKEFQDNKAKQGEGKRRGRSSRSSVVLPDKCFYDKTRCFFDNISTDCGRNCRMTLAEEQRLNMQTFGVNLPVARARRFWHSWGHASCFNRRTLWSGDGRPGMPKAGVRAVSSAGQGAGLGRW